MSSGRFIDRVALITGASRGIGLAVARLICAEGGRVCLTARNVDALEQAVAELGGLGTAMAVAGKADDPEHQTDAIAQTLAGFGRLDILINNTGVNHAFGPLLDVDAAAARKILEVNLIGALGWVQAAHRASFGEHGGVIVNVASAAGLRAATGIGFYGASKAALIHLTQQLALELAPTVRVNAVAPAVVRTRMGQPLFEGQEAAASARYPLRRLGEPEDIANAIAYLASSESVWVTGQVLLLDGGLLLGGGP